MKWGLLAGWLVVAVGQYSSVGRLKQVEIDDEMLYVSNYLIEDAIALAEIEKVTQRRGLNIEPVCVTFSREMDFGNGSCSPLLAFTTGASGANIRWSRSYAEPPNSRGYVREVDEPSSRSLSVIAFFAPSRLRAIVIVDTIGAAARYRVSLSLSLPLKNSFCHSFTLRLCSASVVANTWLPSLRLTK
jgi:hypothetical protein